MTKPKLSTLYIIRILKERCTKFAKRLEDLHGGRGCRVGCNPNVLMHSWLEKAEECAAQVELEVANFEKKTCLVVESEHGDSELDTYPVEKGQ